MKIFYHVQNDTEMATCQYLANMNFLKDSNKEFTIMSLIPWSVDEVQLCRAANVLMVSGTFDISKGYEVNTASFLPIVGFKASGKRIVYYVTLPKEFATDGVDMVCYEMDGINETTSD